jgi:hypothetical protein
MIVMPYNRKQIHGVHCTNKIMSQNKKLDIKGNIFLEKNKSSNRIRDIGLMRKPKKDLSCIIWHNLEYYQFRYVDHTKNKVYQYLKWLILQDIQIRNV